MLIGVPSLINVEYPIGDNARHLAAVQRTLVGITIDLLGFIGLGLCILCIIVIV